MSTQITVRRPEDLVAFVDPLVAEGAVTSRADAVARAVARERRRQVAPADVEILSRLGSDPGPETLADDVAAHPVDLDA